MLTRLILIAATIFGLTGAAMAQATVEDLMQADRDFSQMAQDGEVREAFLAFMAEDAVMLQPGLDIIDGEGAAHAFITDWPGGVNLRWEPVGGMIAASGDLGFTYGRYVSWGTSAEGEEVESHGKYVTIWQLQEDGSWKWVLDGGNVSAAPAE